ncbi:putative ketoacyl reductase [Streptomyces sp. MBT84]|uniref:SDR family oxidoreductase n=1 Tax=unclassified Streptomyces TaxID=2593676 RepID=UPI001DF4DBC7|nr:SDR family oxidoreductase [Streptomyces sp. MBT84]MBW8705443.1 putative ketoacyl reductase [Streptomyces sp. MBT84]
MTTTPDRKVILITGTSSGFGNLSAQALARAGHTVYAGMRDTMSRNVPAMQALEDLRFDEGIDIRGIDLDVQSQESADNAVQQITTEHRRLDVLIHNAGRMWTGPAEALTPRELAQQYDVNDLGTQRVNRAALPHLRRQGPGHLVWVSSTSARGGCPPFLAPYFAAKAGMDALAVSYGAELIRFGIDTTIIVPGAYPSGTNHFAHAATPADTERAAAYEDLYGETIRTVPDRLAALFPKDASAHEVADAIVKAVAAPPGARPWRVHIDPSHDGSEVVLGRRRPYPRRIPHQRRPGRPAHPQQPPLNSPATPTDRWAQGAPRTTVASPPARAPAHLPDAGFDDIGPRRCAVLERVRTGCRVRCSNGSRLHAVRRARGAGPRRAANQFRRPAGRDERLSARGRSRQRAGQELADPEDARGPIQRGPPCDVQGGVRGCGGTAKRERVRHGRSGGRRVRCPQGRPGRTRELTQNWQILFSRLPNDGGR